MGEVANFSIKFTPFQISVIADAVLNLSGLKPETSDQVTLGQLTGLPDL